MKIRIWGAQGSLPSPLKSREINAKIVQAIMGMPDLNTNDPEAVQRYVDDLPTWIQGTAKGNTSCVEVQAGSETIIIDAGTGIRELGLELLKGPCGLGQGRLHILFSHLHWDHINGFPFFLPAFIPGNHITFYGIHDLEMALTAQQRYLFFPVAFDAAQAERELNAMDRELRQRYGFVPSMQATYEFAELSADQSFAIGPVEITTSRNHHPGDSYGYRLEDQHSIFVYGGDSEYKELDASTFEERVAFFQDADAVLFDAQYGLRDSWENKADYGHGSAMLGVDFARQAGVKKLLLTHHEPTYSDQQLEEIRQTALAYQKQDSSLPTCEIIVASEGLELDLTPDDAIDVQISQEENAAILAPGRVVDNQSVVQIIKRMTEVAATDASIGSIIDLSQVERLTIASLKTLVTYSHRRHDGPAILAGPTRRVQEVINLAGYGDYFAIYPTVSAAIKAVQIREVLKLPGHTINDRYQIVETLGHSNVGMLLKVFDRVKQHQVALRLLSPTFGTETCERFLGQMRQLLHWAHDHATQVFDCDWTQDGNYIFVAEELVDCPTLQERLTDARNPLPTDKIVGLAAELMLVLEEAHERGIIHGNLKPQDIFISEVGVKVSGFNLGRLDEGRALQTAPLLHVAPAYLSPEQILGQPLDSRTDLYALGVILYRLFTGQLPFEGDDNQVMRAHLHDAPPAPKSLNPELSRSIEHLILKLLAKDPNERYVSAMQVREIFSGIGFGVRDETVQTSRQHLVGRRLQLETLRTRWLAAAAGHGQMVFLTGEPGIGKSTLARQAALRNNHSVVLQGHCVTDECRPAYQPFAEILGEYFATVPSVLADPAMRQSLANISALAPNLKQMVPDLPEPPHIEPQHAQLRLITSLAQLIKRATEDLPWFLILEDLQWIDEASVEVLRFLSSHLSDMNVLVVATYRDLEVGSDHPLQSVLREMDHTPACLHLPLDRLTKTDAVHLLVHLWAPEVPDALANSIYHHTGGNPLYIEEVARGLLDDGLVGMRAGRWQYPEVEQIQLPHSAYAAIEHRIHQLNVETRDILSQAAILGGTFRFHDLMTLCGLSEWALLDHLDVMLERQLIQELNGGESLRFKHAEIHHVTYDELGALRRRRLHDRAGETIEQRARPEPELRAHELANHFCEARDWKRALDYCVLAAQQAQEIYANEPALHWYERTLGILERFDSDQPFYQDLRLSIHLARGEVLFLIGRYDEALAEYGMSQTLLTEYPSSDGARQQADLYLLTALVQEKRGAFADGIEWIQRGLDLLGKDEATTELARLYYVGGWLYSRLHKMDEAIEWTQRALWITKEPSDHTGKFVQAIALNNMGTFCLGRSDFVGARKYFHTSLSIAEQIEDLGVQLYIYNSLGTIDIRLGKWLQAETSFARGHSIAQETGDVFEEARLHCNAGLLDLYRGDLDQAMYRFQQAMVVWRQVGALRDEAYTLIDMAQAQMYQGRWSSAREWLEQGQALLSEVGAGDSIPRVQRVWAELCLGTGDLVQASDHVNRSIDSAADLSDPLEEGISQRVLGQVYRAQGRLNLAENKLHRSLQLLSEIHATYQIAKTKLLLAVILTDKGILSQGRENLNQATAMFASLGAKSDLADALELAQRYAAGDSTAD